MNSIALSSLNMVIQLYIPFLLYFALSGIHPPPLLQFLFKCFKDDAEWEAELEGELDGELEYEMVQGDGQLDNPEWEEQIQVKNTFYRQFIRGKF